MLSLEHLGHPHGVHDGMCISILLEANSRELEKGRGYQWQPVPETLQEMVKDALARNCAQLVY